MSASPNADVRVAAVHQARLSPAQYAALTTTLAVLGLSTIWFPLRSLWEMWTTDALKSIGMMVPLVSLLLILRVWRAQEWRADGSWWGLPLLLAAVALARIQEQMLLIMAISPHWSTVLPPPSFVLLVYGAGAVLLLGGTQMFRAAMFPIALLWFANPVPHIFSLTVDLPLQEASAHVARAFAMRLGHPLTRDSLRLMFTPDFGMFIAPGCNGIRGSVTMGFIALIAGYIYRFRWYANALVVVGAVALGYVFNLARLCLLVLYYGVALHFQSLQNRAEGADYVIGAALFLLATALLFAATHHCGVASKTTPQSRTAVLERGLGKGCSQWKQHARLAAMGVIALFGCAGLGQAAMVQASGMTIAARRFPAEVGGYTLVRTWNESVETGHIIYYWADYAPSVGGTPIAIGVSPVPDWHDPVLCHTARGEDPLWHGQLTIQTAGASAVNFSSAFYNDGVTRYMEASTMCRGGACSEFTTERSHFGFTYTHPDPKLLLAEKRKIPLRILLRAETIDGSVPDDVARQQLTTALRSFLARVNLEHLTESDDR